MNDPKLIKERILVNRGFIANIGLLNIVHRKHCYLIKPLPIFHLSIFQDECSFVSLREVSRLMHICSWFYDQRKSLFPQMDELKKKQFLESKREQSYKLVGEN